MAPREFSFPRDHGAHEGFQTEWWYFTGNLQSDDAQFGYQLTFFRFLLSPETPAVATGSQAIFMAHFALTDLDGQLMLNRKEEITAETLVCVGGEIVNARVLEAMER